MDELQLALWPRLLSFPGVEEGENSWGDDRALWTNAKQMANFSSERALEIRLSRRVKRELRESLESNPAVDLRGTSSDWISVAFASEADFPLILELASRAAGEYLPRDGSAPKPPPTGAAMAARKCFH